MERTRAECIQNTTWIYVSPFSAKNVDNLGLLLWEVQDYCSHRLPTYTIASLPHLNAFLFSDFYNGDDSLAILQ